MNIDDPALSTPVETGSETVRIQRWSAPECPFAIDYSTEVLNRMRQRAVEAFHTLPHGGLEIGGLLFGRVMPNARNPLRVEIATERGIECAHAAGPSFILSEEEIAGIATFLERSRFDAEIAALSVVGFWVSHSRTHIGLSLDDQELFKKLFPYHWQIVLVMKPESGATTRATFFFRSNGRVQPHEQRYEFGVDGPLPAALQSLSNQSVSSLSVSAQSVSTETQEPVAGRQKYQPIAPERRGEFSATFSEPATVAEAGKATRGSRKFGVLPVTLLMLCSAFAGGALTYSLRDFWQPATTLKGHDPDLNLEVFETESALLIHWNSKAVEIQNAARGELSIQEGNNTQSLPMKLNALLQGFLVYQPRGGDVLVSIKIFGQDGTVEQASAHYGSAQPDRQ